MIDMEGKSFTCTLRGECDNDNTQGPHLHEIDYQRNARDREGGWLVLGSRADELLHLHFTFIGDYPNGMQYEIRCVGGEYDGAMLGISRNQYVGFYSVASVTELWTINLVPLEGGPDLEQNEFDFILQDGRGWSVRSQLREPWAHMPQHGIDFLTVEDQMPMILRGKILSFD